MLWHDRTGSFSPLKAATLALLCLPALWLAWRWGMGTLGPRRLDAAIHYTGNWAVRILVASLLVTPLRQILRRGRLILIRRMVGVAALAYAVLHLLLFIADQNFQLGHVAAEIIKRVYLWIGFAALLGLIALGATSFDSAIRRLGARAWGRLHRWVYPIALLGLIHFSLQTKSDVTEATLTTGLFLWLMAYRLAAPRNAAPAGWVLLALAPGCGLATAALEFAWYGLATGINPWRVLEANLDVAYGPRPALWVGLLALLPFLLRFWPTPTHPHRAAPA